MKKGLFRDSYDGDLPRFLNSRFIEDPKALVSAMKKYGVTMYLHEEDDLKFAKKHKIPFKKGELVGDSTPKVPTIRNTMVDCYSFDAFENLPGWVDTSHDGQFIDCLIEYRGGEKLVHFWGD